MELATSELSYLSSLENHTLINKKVFLMSKASVIKTSFIPRVGNAIDVILFLKVERKEYPRVTVKRIVLMSAVPESSVCSQNYVDPKDCPPPPPTPYILTPELPSSVELSIPQYR
jgi:hypothetical protein